MPTHSSPAVRPDSAEPRGWRSGSASRCLDEPADRGSVGGRARGTALVAAVAVCRGAGRRHAHNVSGQPPVATDVIGGRSTRHRGHGCRDARRGVSDDIPARRMESDSVLRRLAGCFSSPSMESTRCGMAPWSAGSGRFSAAIRPPQTSARVWRAGVAADCVGRSHYRFPPVDGAGHDRDPPGRLVRHELVQRRDRRGFKDLEGF